MCVCVCMYVCVCVKLLRHPWSSGKYYPRQTLIDQPVHTLHGHVALYCIVLYCIGKLIYQSHGVSVLMYDLPICFQKEKE